MFNYFDEQKWLELIKKPNWNVFIKGRTERVEGRFISNFIGGV